MISEEEYMRIKNNNLIRKLIQIRNELITTSNILNDINVSASNSIRINNSVVENENIKDLKSKTQRTINNINNLISSLQD